MAYIDLAYYRSEYMGIPILDDDELTSLIKRASVTVDGLTGYAVKVEGLESFPQFVQDQFKLAVASQVEFLKTFGVTSSAFTSSPQNVSIGKFSYDNGQKTSARYASNLLEILLPTGLIGGSVRVKDSGGGYSC
jgi:hypothetical protein